MEITIQQLKALLDEQKKITAEGLLNSTSYYNNASTESVRHSLDLNRDKFLDIAINSSYPNDFIVLNKYKITKN